MNDMDFSQADQETIESLQLDLDSAYEQIRELAQLIRQQDSMIASMRERFKAHGIHVLERPISETLLEDLKKISDSIPKSRTTRAKSDFKERNLTLEEQIKQYRQQLEENNPWDMLVKQVTSGVDLEKYGIDPNTLNFKPGYGPKATDADVQTPKKLTFWQRLKALFWP